MLTIKQLQKKREEARALANKLAAEANAGDTLMTAEQKTAVDAAIADVSAYDAQIATLKALQEADRTTDAVAPGFDAQVGKNHAEEKPWASLGEQLMAVKSYSQSRGHQRDARLFAAFGANETVDAEGGFLVAPEYSKELLTRTFSEGVVTSRCRTVPMASPRLVINGVDDSNRVGGYLGAGLAVYRIAEAALYTASKLKYRRVELNANKLIGMYFATDEVLEDTNALESLAMEEFPKAFAWTLDNEAINGTGAGQFLGILTSGATVAVPKVSGQAAKTFVTQNALDMRSRLWVKSRPNSVWFTGPDVEDQLFGQTIPGPQGTSVALYTPPGVYGNTSDYGLMLGRPVIPIEQTASIGTQGDIILADCSQYMIGDRSGLKMASSIHVAFETGEQAFRWTLRNDGQPLWDRAVTQNNSTNKVSPFVTLQNR